MGVAAPLTETAPAGRRSMRIPTPVYGESLHEQHERDMTEIAQRDDVAAVHAKLERGRLRAKAGRPPDNDYATENGVRIKQYGNSAEYAMARLDRAARRKSM